MYVPGAMPQKGLHHRSHRGPTASLQPPLRAQRTNGMSIFNHNIYNNIRTRVIVVHQGYSGPKNLALTQVDIGGEP